MTIEKKRIDSPQQRGDDDADGRDDRDQQATSNVAITMRSTRLRARKSGRMWVKTPERRPQRRHQRHYRAADRVKIIGGTIGSTSALERGSNACALPSATLRARSISRCGSWRPQAGLLWRGL